MNPRIPTRRSRRPVSRNRNRRGASAVEFALVFPLIVIMFIGSVAFTQAFLLRDTAQHAAYKGVRKGIVWDSTTDDVKTEVKTFLQKMGVKKAEITTVPESIDNTTNQITVKVSIPMNENAWVASPFMPAGFKPGSQITINRTEKE